MYDNIEETKGDVEITVSVGDKAESGKSMIIKLHAHLSRIMLMLVCQIEF